jgi:hypothetical protein
VRRWPRFLSAAVLPAVLALCLCACAGSVRPLGPGDSAGPVVACDLGPPGGPAAPAGFQLVPPGTIAFGWDVLHNASTVGSECGAQAVRNPRDKISLASLEGEDRIPWVAVFARPGRLAPPDPLGASMTLVRLESGTEVLVDSQVASGPQYMMLGNYGHDARVGAYLMRIVSGTGALLAHGRFEITP